MFGVRPEGAEERRRQHPGAGSGRHGRVEPRRDGIAPRLRRRLRRNQRHEHPAPEVRLRPQVGAQHRQNMELRGGQDDDVMGEEFDGRGQVLDLADQEAELPEGLGLPRAAPARVHEQNRALVHGVIASASEEWQRLCHNV